MMKVNCSICNKQVNRKPKELGKYVYCSHKCRTSKRIKKICPCCDVEIIKKPSEVKKYTFCSVKCRKIYTKKRRRTICKYCGKIFYPEKKSQVFCRKLCQGSSIAILDYSKKILNEELLEYLDGFLLGDGGLSKDSCRLTWRLKYKEFSDYFFKLFIQYKPKTRTYKIYDSRIKKYTNGFSGHTKTHPELKQQRKRWYPNDKKIVPKDINITSKSVLLWYLGDGVLCGRTGIELCTDSFEDNYINILVNKLKNININAKTRVHDKKGKRIVINLDSIKNFFDFIGWKSPIKCYDYKFNIPQEIRYCKQTSDIAMQLNVNRAKILNIKRNIFKNKIASINCSYWWTPEETQKIKESLGT